MDPLSGPASVIAVIQLTDVIVRICGKYIIEVKGAKHQIVSLYEGTEAFQKVLESLKEVLEGPQSVKAACTQTVSQNIDGCFSKLDSLRERIDPENTKNTKKPMRRWGLRAWKWPLNQGDVERAINEIERYKTLFSFALSTDQLTSIGTLDQKFDLDKIKISEGAEFDSYDNRHNECLAGTRVELLDQIKDWAASPQAKCVFWLCGLAGTGKSTLSRTVAAQLKERKLLGASFFFQRGEKDRGNAKRLFATLALQLADRIPELNHGILKAIDDDPRISEKSPKEQFDKLLFEPFQDLKLDQTSIMVIVIDALDECETVPGRDDIRTILQLLPQLQKSTSVHLKVFLTSRPEISLRLGFKDIAADHQDFILHEIPKPDIEHDIALFLDHRLSGIRTERSLPPEWPGETTVHALVGMSMPLFIFAATVCRTFDDHNLDPVGSLNEILQYQNEDSKLAGTYLPVLNRDIGKYSDEKQTELAKEFRDIVGTIVILESPLSITSLANLTCKSKMEINARLNSLHSILNIPNEETKPVRLFHLSFRDFLVDPKTRESRKTPFWVDEKMAHQNLTGFCLRVMRELKRNICNLPNDGVDRLEITGHVIDQNLPPELQYACRYWVYHLTRSQEPVTLLSEAFSFLRVHLLHWIETMCILNLAPEVVGMIDALRKTSQNGANYEISEYLYDSKRFILKFRQMAENTPLQIYSSGLVFSPKKSIIRREFESEIPVHISRLTRQLDIEETWSAEQQTLEGHSGPVLSVAFSPNGQLLASCSEDCTIKLWDPTTGVEQQTLKGHDDFINLIAFSPNGQLLASCSGDNTIKLWDPTTGAEQQTLKGHDGWIYSVVFSPDGQLLASGSGAGTVKLWDPVTGVERQKLKVHHYGWVNSLAFSSDGQILASASLGESDDTKVELWDPTTGAVVEKQVLEDRYHNWEDWFNSKAISPIGRLRAFVSNARAIKGYQSKHLDPAIHIDQHTLKGHDASISSAALSPDGQLLVSASDDGMIKLWDVGTGTEKQTLQSQSYPVYSVVFSPDGQLLASASDDAVIKLWNLSTSIEKQNMPSRNFLIRSVTFSPNGQLLVSSGDQTIKLWDPATGAEKQTLDGSTQPWSVAFSPDGLQLAYASIDNTIKILDPATGLETQILKGHDEYQPCGNQKKLRCDIISVHFAPNSQLLVSISQGNTIKIWDTIIGTEKHTFTLKRNGPFRIHSAVFSPGEQVLASEINHNNETILWDLATGAEKQTLDGRSAVFSSDGQLLAYASNCNRIKIWNTGTGAEQQDLNGHDGVYSMAFSPDSQLLASVSHDNTIKLWDLVTGTEQHTFYFNFEYLIIESVKFSESGPYLDTSIGSINIQPWYRMSSSLTRSDSNIALLSEQWVTLDGQKALWLPFEYRPECSAVYHGRFAFGHPPGRVSFIGY